MNSRNINFSSNDVPELYLSLWSIRHRMIQRPVDTLSLLETWGISTIETAGFFEYEASSLQNELAYHHMTVCSVVGPPFKIGRDLAFYFEWIDKYFWIFKTKTLVLQSLPENPQETNKSTHAKTNNTISDLLIQIAQRLQQNGVRVSYHCFPHDFRLHNGQSFISHLFARSDVPANLGLQLDTYWLNVSNIAPSTYFDLPIHSVHLNERDAIGRNCVLGNDESKCGKYIRPLIKKIPSINWILENDPSNEEAKYNDGEMMNTLKQCIISWPRFWDSLKLFHIQPNKEEQPIDLSIAPVQISREPGFRIETIPDSTIYKTELDDVLTEYLFGKDYLDPIDFKYPRLDCYVDKRISATSEHYAIKYHAERHLFDLFWPAAMPGEQIIHLVGGAGAGKSTFIRFFFQYFLPYYETLVNGALPESDIAIIYSKYFHQHILLYVDLRRELKTNEIGPFLYEKLGDSLIHAAKKLELEINWEVGQQYTKDWVKQQVSLLAKGIEGNKRKWYISWILDNSDQMEETIQRDLINLLFEWIPEEPSAISPSVPIIDGQCREIWRIIIPIRPETLMGLSNKWSPFKNRKIINLDPIDHDLLVENRAKYLFHKVLNSTKNPFVDVWEIHPGVTQIEQSRPHFNMVVPIEKAPEMQESLRIAHGRGSEIQNEHGIPDSARPIFDQLINNSARRRLYIVRKVAFSHAFHERQRQDRLSKFYFLEGLIRGNELVFQPNDPENLVLNLYSMGHDPKNNPYSIFVGLHSVYLLNKEHQWDDVKSALGRIGYPEKHLLQCEIYFKSKELIKEISGIWQVELLVVQGHWTLLKERAYTDNMAVACAIVWNSPKEAMPTDPLFPATLLPRFTSSLWFLKQIWAAEGALACYPSDLEVQKRIGNFNDFATSRKALDLPSITYLASQEYLDRMKGLYEYVRPKLVIDKERNTWDKNISDLKNLVNQSKKRDALESRRI